MGYQRAELPLKLDGLDAARSFFMGWVTETGSSSESIWVAHVDEQANCLYFSRHKGSESGADLPIGSIIKDAARYGSSGIILAHNHPSGDPTPSNSDRRATRRLATAAEALDCTVVDHLVFANGKCASFRSMGLL
jgi:DNA repair protein RadC